MDFKILKYNLIIIFYSLWALLIIFSYLFFSDYNFDLSDESYYILSSLYLKNIIGIHSHFGYLFSSILQDLNFNIRAFRIFGIVSYLFANIYFIFNFAKYITRTNQIDNIKYELILVFIVASFYFYKHWLLTPSYNLNVVISLLIYLGTYFYYLDNEKNLKKFSKKYFIIIFLLSIFLLISVLSKITSILIFLSLFFIFFFLTENKIKYLTFALGIVTSFFFLFIFYCKFYFTSFENFLTNFLNGVFFMKLLNAGYDEVSFISNIFYSFNESVIYFINNLELQLLYFIACTLLFFFFKIKNQNFVNSFICFAIILFNLIFSYNLTTPLLSLIFTLFLLFFNNYKKILLNIHERKLTKFIILFCFIPFLFSFGTNNNLISHGFYLNGFYVLSNFLLINLFISRKYNLLYLSSTLFMITVISIKSFYYPYGQQQTKSRDFEMVRFAKFGHIKLEQRLAQDLNKIQSVFYKNNWKKGNFILDLSGSYPGITLLIDGKFIGTPWLMGYWPGSENYILNILSKSEIENKTFWIIYSKDPKKNFDVSKVFKTLDINMKDYLNLGSYNLKNNKLTVLKYKN